MLFLIGAVLAVVAGIAFPENGFVALALATLGVVIGVMHIDHKEPVKLVISVLALLLLPAVFASITVLGIGKIIGAVLTYFAVLMAPVALIASIKILIGIGVGVDT